MSEKERQSGEEKRLAKAGASEDTILPTINPEVIEKKVEAAKSGLHPAFYIATWISLSSSVIIFNKWILDTAGFRFPIVLTTWHLIFATIMTQLMARFTSTLDSRKKVPMTGRVYLRAIVPIGLMFSLSLICGNMTYLYLSVSFIQMLKATMPVAVLLTSWIMRTQSPNMKKLGNVSIIVLGVMIASYGEIHFVVIGVLFQFAGIVFESSRLVLMETLLSSAEFKMDPLVSLYYFAPVCAVMNAAVALVLEVPRLHLSDIQNVGYFVLLANAMVAFFLNVSVVFLIGKTSSLVMTLSGVLKDILLVVASMVIFRDPVSGLQAFGYSIALAGLVYYKLGGETLKEYIGAGGRAWAEFGVQRPALRRVMVIAGAFLAVLLLLGGASSSGVVPAEYDLAKQAAKQLGHTPGW